MVDGWGGRGREGVMISMRALGGGLVMYSLLVFDMSCYLSVLIALAGPVMCSNRSGLSVTLPDWFSDLWMLMDSTTGRCTLILHTFCSISLWRPNRKSIQIRSVPLEGNRYDHR